MDKVDEVLLVKLAEHFTEEELEDIVGEAGSELLEEESVEKTASEYYELGQIMAIGFQDQLEKEAMPKALEAVRGAGKALAGGYSKARKGGLLRGGKGKLESAKAALKGLSGSQRKTLGGAAAVGGLGAAGAGYAASKMMKKKSYDEGVYDTLAYLDLLEDE